MAETQWTGASAGVGRARAVKESHHVGPCCGCWSPQLEKRWRSRSEDDHSGSKGKVIGVIEGSGGGNLSQILGPWIDGDGPSSKEDPGDQTAKYPPLHPPPPTRRAGHVANAGRRQ